MNEIEAQLAADALAVHIDVLAVRQHVGRTSSVGGQVIAGAAGEALTSMRTERAVFWASQASACGCIQSEAWCTCPALEVLGVWVWSLFERRERHARRTKRIDDRAAHAVLPVRRVHAEPFLTPVANFVFDVKRSAVGVFDFVAHSSFWVDLQAFLAVAADQVAGSASETALGTRIALLCVRMWPKSDLALGTDFKSDGFVIIAKHAVGVFTAETIDQHLIEASLLLAFFRRDHFCSVVRFAADAVTLLITSRAAVWTAIDLLLIAVKIIAGRQNAALVEVWTDALFAHRRAGFALEVRRLIKSVFTGGALQGLLDHVAGHAVRRTIAAGGRVRGFVDD